MRQPPRSLQVAAFCSTFDRFSFAPMLVTIAADLQVRLQDVALAATLYFLMYGLMQPVWGMLSDRLGRVRLMRITLLSAAVAGLASAASPTLMALIALRGLTGGLYAAAIPTSLTYVGDTVSIDHRHEAMTEMMAATSAAMAVGSLAGGVAAALGQWRLAFALPAIGAAAVAIVLARLPEPATEPNGGPLKSLVAVMRERWAVLVVLLSAVEGGLVMGALTFFPAALEHGGVPAAVAGSSVAVYGLSLLFGTRIVKRAAAANTPPAVMLAIGGVLIAAGLGLAAARQSAAAVAAGAMVLGFGFSGVHTTLQTWATDVLPQARAMVVSLFVSGAFAGSSLMTAVAAPIADAGRYAALFGVAALLAVPLTLVATTSARRYQRLRGQGEEPPALPQVAAR